MSAVCGNASSRLSETVPGDGTLAWGGYADLDALYGRQAHEADAMRRAALLAEIQDTLHARTRFAPIYGYIWASGVGSRVGTRR